MSKPHFPNTRPHPLTLPISHFLILAVCHKTGENMELGKAWLTFS